MEASKLFINNAEFVWIAIFSPRSWNNSMVGVINFLYALADDHVSQIKPTTADCVQCHAQGSGGFSEGLFVECTQLLKDNSSLKLVPAYSLVKPTLSPKVSACTSQMPNWVI